MREEEVRMSLFRWTRWCKGRRPGIVKVYPLWDLQGPLQECKLVTQAISWDGIRAIPPSCQWRAKCQWKGSWPVHYQQQAQCKDRTRASNAQRWLPDPITVFSQGLGIEFEVKIVVMSDSLWPHGLYSTWNSPGQNTGVGSHSLLQRIFPTQGSNPGLPHWRRILYQLSHKGSPRIFPTQESSRGLLHCRQHAFKFLFDHFLCKFAPRQ